ncbi:MAG: helix-turn-helix domain-containing protein, partial [Acetobacteraceae bacterium]|nr:helix-turn-helix domain-containing protein [Acetobacteraceae bacterium]
MKADAAEGGQGWSDSEIAAALDISVATVAQTRQQLVEEGFEAVAAAQALSRLGQAAHLRWRLGGQADRPDLLRA